MALRIQLPAMFPGKNFGREDARQVGGGWLISLAGGPSSPGTCIEPRYGHDGKAGGW